MSAADNAEPSTEAPTRSSKEANAAPPAPGAKASIDQAGNGDITPPPADDGPSGGSPSSSNAVYSQQLWEVQLLLDFLSGNPGQKLPNPDNATAAGLPADWIEQVCRMTWPPSGSAVEQADQEALLVKVKDYLNGMASPANGFSVAFTLLVTQEDGSTDRPARRMFGGGEPHQGSSPALRPGVTESRGSLARKAYPDLGRKAQKFRHGMWWIAFSLTIWLGVTCLLSWSLALGNSELGQLATAQAAFDTVQVKIAAAQNAQSAGSSSSSTGKPTTPVAVDPAVQEAATSGVDYCEQSELLGTKKSPLSGKQLRVYVSPTQAEVCQAYDRSRADLESAKTNIRHWLPWHGSRDQGAGAVYYATAIVSMLGAAILPVCYGILGAAAAVLRLLSRKMRLSLLTPRDLSLAVQQLALGAVVGACIGIFVASPSNNSSNANQLLGPVSLSGSALSFIAGFGVDSVFSALEALIARIFNTSPSPTKSVSS